MSFEIHLTRESIYTRDPTTPCTIICFSLRSSSPARLPYGEESRGMSSRTLASGAVSSHGKQVTFRTNGWRSLLAGLVIRPDQIHVRDVI